MKRLLNLCIAIIATTIGATAQTNNVVGAAQFNRYAAENKAVPPRQKDEKRVVFIGNSITEFWNHTHPEFFTRNGYINRGIAGQTSYTLLLRFRADAIDLDPTTIVLGIGCNDIAVNDGAPYDEDRTYANIVTMAELAKAHGIKIVLTTILPTASFPWRPEITDAPDKIENLNRRIRAYATAHSIPFADYYTPMVHPGDRALPVTFSDDGVHPNASGYTIMEPVIHSILTKL